MKLTDKQKEELSKRLGEQALGIVEEVIESKLPELWKPTELFEKYFCTTDTGTLDYPYNPTMENHNKRIENYNVYPDREAAEKVAKWQRALRKLEAIKRYLGKNANNKQEYYIYQSDKETNVSWCVQTRYIGVQFENYYSAQEAIRMMGEDLNDLFI